MLSTPNNQDFAYATIAQLSSWLSSTRRISILLRIDQWRRRARLIVSLTLVSTRDATSFGQDAGLSMRTPRAHQLPPASTTTIKSVYEATTRLSQCARKSTDTLLVHNLHLAKTPRIHTLSVKDTNECGLRRQP
eukprot:4033776-Amphidinium_carterae.1